MKGAATTWPTPDSGVFNDAEEPESFLDRQARQKAKGINGNGMGMTLAMASKVWPTPTANDFKGSGPTLIRQDGKMRGDRLDYAAEQFWSTPRASDGEKGGPNQSFGAGGQPLPAQATSWATPRVEMSRALGNPKHITGNRGKGFLEDQVVAWPPAMDLYSPLALTTVKTGKPCSKERRSLNPLFVEWLMGWPPGWTLIHEIRLVSSGFACSETALSRFRRDMRCALSRLALHDAPPAQASLFG